MEFGALANLARYVTAHDDGGFTGPLLAHGSSKRHQLEEAALASLLGCSESDLVHLALCGRPRPDQFASDVARIAEHVHARTGLLRGLYQEALLLPARLYKGWWADDDWHVTAGGKPLKSIGYHGPDGFAWGYDGSACSELSLSLLRGHLRE